MGRPARSLLQWHWQEVKMTHCNLGLPEGLRWQRICLQCRKPGFDPWIGKITWRREWLLDPVFRPGESYGQRSLAGCCPWGHKYMTE